MKRNDTAPQKRTQEVDKVAAKLLLSICDEWGLTEEETARLAGVAVPQLKNWREVLTDGGYITLPEAVRMKASYLANIHKWRQLSIQSGCSNGVWVRHANPDLQGRAPVEYLISGKDDDLIALKQYLQSWYETPYF